jgi:hypothetical protein
MPTESRGHLLARGVVSRRWRQSLASGEEIVFYDLGGLVVQQFRPQNYLAIGECVEAEVQIRAYQAKSGVRYAIELPTSLRGEF